MAMRERITMEGARTLKLRAPIPAPSLANEEARVMDAGSCQLISQAARFEDFDRFAQQRLRRASVALGLPDFAEGDRGDVSRLEVIREHDLASSLGVLPGTGNVTEHDERTREARTHLRDLAWLLPTLEEVHCFLEHSSRPLSVTKLKTGLANLPIRGGDPRRQAQLAYECVCLTRFLARADEVPDVCRLP